ncbi:hypothetical protein QFZ50_000561 [Arthrobacter agilis]|nr:hypothetical protein [Arthrobacter agilis]
MPLLTDLRQAVEAGDFGHAIVAEALMMARLDTPTAG